MSGGKRKDRDDEDEPFPRVRSVVINSVEDIDRLIKELEQEDEDEV